MQNTHFILNISNYDKKMLIKSIRKPQKLKSIDENTIAILLKNEIVKVDVNSPVKSYCFTDKGKQYIKLMTDEYYNKRKENIRAWVSLLCAIFAIIISTISLALDIYLYNNNKTEIVNDNNEIITETTEQTSTKDLLM